MSLLRSFSLLNHRLLPAGLLAVAAVLALVATPARAQVLADFNDLGLGDIWPQGGGTGFNTGWGNLSSTGVVDVVSGDLYAPSGTAYGIFQTGDAQSVQSIHGSASRRVGRGIDPVALPSNSDDIWFSFLARSDTAGRWAGIDLNNAGSSQALVVDERIMLRGTDLFIGGATGATIDVSSRHAIGETGLIVGKLVTGSVGDSETLDIWFNPDLSGGESGLLGMTPDFTSSDMGWDFSGITRLGLQSYVDGGQGGIIDNVRLSNSATAFVDVVGTPLVNSEWNVDASGNWSDVSNWSTVSPTGGLDVIFGGAISSGRTVTMDVTASAGLVTFDNASSYTIAPGAGSLNLSNGATAISGSHTISTDYLASANSNTFHAGAGATLNLTGTATAIDMGSVSFVLDGAGNGTIGAIRDNNDTGNALDGTDNISVIKRGAGTWTIGSGTTTAEDFHGGDTTIEAGTLKVKSNSPGGTQGELRSPHIAVQAGATFDTSEFSTYSMGVEHKLSGAGTVDTGAGTLQVFSDNTVAPGDSVGTLTVDGNLRLNSFEGSSPTGGLEFELSPSTASGNDRVVVNGNITSNAGGGGNKTGIVLVPTGLSLGTGTYELITFSGSHTGSAADYTVAGLTTRYNLGITVDSDSVNLDVSGSNANLVWRGNDGGSPTNWDLNTTSNWDNGGGSDTYYDLDNVTFDDTAIGTTANLQEDVAPASVTFNNNSKDITLFGPGGIKGGTGITKSGTGRVTIVSPNSYTGVTNITAGVLHAGHSKALGDASGETIVNGGALDITHSNIAGEVVHIQGAGSDGRGALMTDGLDSLGGSAQQITAVVQDGDATIAAYYDGVDDEFNQLDYRWDLEPGNGLATSWQGNGHNLTKKGRGAVAINSTGEMNVGDIHIEAGSLQLYGTATSTGSTVTVGAGSPLQEDFTGNPELRFFNGVQFAGPPPPGATQAMDIVLNGGVLNNESEDEPVFTLSGSIQTLDVSGDAEVDNVINGNSTVSTIPNGITGSGGLQFGSNATGSTELQGNNTYTGNTRVVGNLALTGSAQLSGTPQIDIDGPAGAMDVTGRSDGTLTLSNQMLNVNDGGAFVGAVTATGASVVSVSSSNPLDGDVTISNGSRLIGKKNEADLGAGKVAGNVAIELGGTLQVDTGLGTAQVVPNAFQQDGAHTIGGHRYVAFEAEDFTLFNDNGFAITWEVEADGAALGGDKITATGASETTAGNDDTVQYDMVFTEPGTYYWYVRTQAPGGNQTDSFYGPNQDANTDNPSVAPGGGMSRFGVSDELKDAEGSNGITTSWDWLRSDPNAASQGAFVDFEKIVVTQDDVDTGRLFSLQFEPRQPGAQIDKMVLADTFDFADIDDTLLDGATSLTSGLVNIDAPFLTFDIDGDLELDAGSIIEIDLRSLEDFDNLSVTGTADLFGGIAVNLDGYTPDVNDTFTVLTTNGGIDDTSLSLPSGFSHAVVGNDLVLTFTGTLGVDGDYNDDGVVDAADYTVWRDNLGLAVDLPNDPTPGIVGDDDYVTWVGNYGMASPGSLSLVPEPSALLLVLAAGLGLASKRVGRASA